MIEPIKFNSAKKIHVSGATSAGGIPYVRIKACGQKAHVPLADFAGSNTVAREKLVAANIILLRPDWARCVALVEGITKFPPKPIIVAPGRAGAGPKGVGKSTLQRLAAAVVGGGVEQPGRNYWISANTTSNGLEAAFPEHDDLPMILEELNLFAAGETERNRATKIDELVFRLSDGSTKARFGSNAQRSYRFVYIASTNEPLAHVLLGYRRQVSEAAAFDP